MAFLAVEGVFRDGKVELSEVPAEAREGRVMVVFLDDSATLQQSWEIDEGARRAAAEHLLARMKRGYHLGGGRPYDKREELYDRHERRR